MTDHARRVRAAVVTAAAGLALTACTVLLPAQPHHATTHPAPAHTTPAAGPAPLTPGHAAGLLPFTPAQLAAAAALASRFATAYSTWSWRQAPAAWLTTLPSVAGQLDGTLAQAAATPGLLAQRTQAHQAATATTGGAQIRDLTPGSVTLTLAVRQVITSTAGTTASGTSLAITLTPSSSGGWQVYDVEPASAGNTGGN